ncbi:MAG: glycosyl transferase family protein [Gammaproteobacteria bacterium]|nr:glycosyl transferase family protein [Gammaproteobacteria bacterium]
MYEEHLFAQYIRILGKGKRGSRGLTEKEAFDSMKMILDGKVEECQLGAYLMLLRVKEESPEEVAGFVRAIKTTFTLPENAPAVQLDWSSYAGKRRHLPWFLLSAFLLAENKISVFMHGAEGHTAGRVYTRDFLEQFSQTICENFEQASNSLSTNYFAYLPLEFMSPIMHRIIQMRPLLGLRSPVHTIARMLNPFKATCEIQGIFHPSYRDTHQHAALLLGQPNLSVFKGEGGEIERNPDQKCLVKNVINGELSEEEWPSLFTGPRHLKDEEMDPTRMIKVWRGEDTDEYAVASITGTAAIALKLLGQASTTDEAQALAEKMWDKRQKSKFQQVA